MIAATTVEVERYRFSMDEFDRLHEVGILAEDDRVEFLDGELIAMSKVSGRHTGCIIRLDRAIQRVSDEEILISVQNPLRLNDRADFLPDLVVFRGAAESNDSPSAERVLMVIEVADSSLYHDRNEKFPRYAAAGIPEAWLIDLTLDRIERHTEPRDGGYRQIIWAQRGESLTSTVLPELTLEVDAVLGPPEEA